MTDYKATLNLPDTAFPMKAGLSQRCRICGSRWDSIGLYGKLREIGKDRPKFVLHDGMRVSSTQVRKALAEADFALAEHLLGRPYQICGRVLHGQKLARQLGTPTANIQLKRRHVPLTGVYLTSAEIDGQRWPGIANIGVRPSVAGDGRPHLEIHLLDYTGDLYDQRLAVQFHHKLREEQRFASLEALKSAIDADIAAARAHWHAQPLTKSLK